MSDTARIRNFCIIAHIDHGKSTLADRFLEITHSIENRKMREQFLDQMDIERERGITIKMQPVRMHYVCDGDDYILHLIDTPGHIDFQYEVSRALRAVEGAILLVDAVQGVQAQTIANLELARSMGLTIIPVINKIDSPNADVESARDEIVALLQCQREDVLKISAKTGDGVDSVLRTIIEKIPPPQTNNQGDDRFQALIFDSHYSAHKGVLAYVRVLAGSFHIAKLRTLKLIHKNVYCEPVEVGIFLPAYARQDVIAAGEIGYIATNIKEPELVRVGDTIAEIAIRETDPETIEGYQEPRPMVWASLYPALRDEFDSLKDAFVKLRLNDASLTYEVEGSHILGRALRVGFLGILHLEITVERLKREFGVEVVVAQPSVEYQAEFPDKRLLLVRDPETFSHIKGHFVSKEPWFFISVITRMQDIGNTFEVLRRAESEIGEAKPIGSGRAILEAIMPLRRLVADVFDELKSATQGYGSLSYEFFDVRPVDLVVLKTLVAEKEILPLSRLIPQHEAEFEARKLVDRLHGLLPRQVFALKIQASVDGRILASRTLAATSKNVTAKLYGGDRTRKMKLWKKQKKGKKRLASIGGVDIPQNVYLDLLKRN